MMADRLDEHAIALAAYRKAEREAFNAYVEAKRIAWEPVRVANERIGASKTQEEWIQHVEERLRYG